MRWRRSCVRKAEFYSFTKRAGNIKVDVRLKSCRSSVSVPLSFLFRERLLPEIAKVQVQGLRKTAAPAREQRKTGIMSRPGKCSRQSIEKETWQRFPCWKFVLSNRKKSLCVAVLGPYHRRPRHPYHLTPFVAARQHPSCPSWAGVSSSISTT